MRVPVSLAVALEAIRRNALRTSLAVLGLVIGVAAVVTMVALGRGARASVTDEVTSAGANLVRVRAGNYTRGGDAVDIPSGLGKATTLVPSDARAIEAIGGVERVTVEVDERAPMLGALSYFGPILGVEPTAARVYAWDVAGAFFGEPHVESSARVAVLGGRARRELFGEEDPVGRTVAIRGQSFEVLGTLQAGDAGHAESVVVPYTALQALLGIDYLHGITVFAETAGETTRIAEEIRALLRERHGLDARDEAVPQGPSQFAMVRSARFPDDFTVRTEASSALTKGLYTTAAAFVLASMPRLDEVTSEEMVNTLTRANRTMTLLLAGIAAIALVVGGIGIMNVMLLAVTERTREIGLRVSVGAKRRDILGQFLLEALALSLFGGILGIVAGFGSSGALTAALGWPTEVSTAAVALAFGLSFAVGVVFGYYPAHRASRLDPIDALRYE